MTSFIADCVVRFRFDDYPSARIPNELAPDEIAGTAERVTLEKISPHYFTPLAHRAKSNQRSGW
jgi:hypothetical protein